MLIKKSSAVATASKRRRKRRSGSFDVLYFLIGNLAATSFTIVTMASVHQSRSGFTCLQSILIGAVGALITVMVVAMWRQKRRPMVKEQTKMTKLTHFVRLARTGEISASIIHEVTHSLSSFSINIEAMELSLARGDEAALKAIVADMKREQHRANEVVQRLRNFLSNRQLQFESTDMNKTVASMLELLSVDLRNRNVAVHANLASELLPVAADPVHLEQILMNLLINAMDAMSDTPCDSRLIEVSTGFFGKDQAEVVVSDSGSGMTREQLEHAFDKFFTTKKSGMGLGLSITRWIVMAHHGAIWAEQRPTGGTSFHFTIPLSATN